MPPVYSQPSDTRLWRNWTGNGFRGGEIWTVPFVAPPVIGVPVQGNMNPESGNRVLIECVSNGRRSDVAHLATFERWSFVLFDARGICGGPVRIGAISDGRELVGIGTPASVSATETLAVRYLMPVTGVILAFLTVGAAWIAGALACARLKIGESEIASLGLIVTGLVALTTVWAFSVSPLVGRSAAAIIFAAAAAQVAYGAYFAAESLARITQYLAKPFAGWAIFAVGVVALGASIDNGGGPFAANVAFFPVTWSTDNQIPVLLADRLAAGVPASQINFGAWLASDRPPLLSGYLLFIHGWLLPAIQPALRYAVDIAEQASGAAIMGLWVPAAWIGLRLARVRDDIIIAILVTTGFTGFCIFNGLYIWPKLLAGGFGLLMILVLACLPSRGQPSPTSSPLVLLVIAAMSGALALLSHGGAFFGVIAALIVCAPMILRQGARPLAVSALLGIATMVPWFIWQAHFQPNGNALLRFLLVGEFGFDRRETSVLGEALHTYNSLGWIAVLKTKWEAIRVVIGVPTTYCNRIERLGSSWTEAPLTTLRVNEFYYLVFLLWLPMLAGTIARLRHAERNTEQNAVMTILAATGAVSVVIWILTSWTCHIVHHFAYQSCLAMMIAGWGVAFMHRGPERLLAPASIALAASAWIASPLFQAIAVRWVWLIILFATILVALAALAPRLFGRDNSCEGAERPMLN